MSLVNSPMRPILLSLESQDMMKMLLSEKSLTARGSLSHIRKLFEIKKNLNCIKLKFQHAWDLDFVTVISELWIVLISFKFAYCSVIHTS